MDKLSLVEAAGLGAAPREALRTIFEDAFPPDLASPFDSLFSDRVLALLSDDATPAGIAVLRDLPGTTWTFLRYFAVGVRGVGGGTALWSLLRAASDAAGCTRILLDVEDPDEPGTEEAEVAVRHRRIRFYERLGVRLLPVERYRPPHDGVGVPMRLMVADLDVPPHEPTPLPDLGALHDIVCTVYAGRYGLPAEDPVVVTTLRASGLLA